MADRSRTITTGCVVALVLLSGCASFTVESTVNADGIIEEYVVEIDTSRTVYGLLSESASEEGYDSVEASFRDEYNESHIGGFEYEETVEGDEATMTITLTDLDPSGSDNITVEQSDGQMTYVDRTFYNESQASGSAESGTNSSEFGESLMSGLSVDYTLRMPGEITDSNADEVDGNTATWNATGSGAMEETEIRATSNVPTSAFGPGFGAVPAILGVLLGTGLLARRLKR